MPPQQALTLAEEKTLDLVEIAPTATPPVCRIMNSGKFFYQQAKRDAEARKHQRHIQVKEVKFRCKIDDHDFLFKARNAERFLEDGNKVKATVIFRGREMAHNEVGRRILERLTEQLREAALVEVPARMEGMTLVQIFTPKEKVAKVKKPVAAKGDKAEKADKADKSDKAARPEPAAAAAESTES